MFLSQQLVVPRAGLPVGRAPGCWSVGPHSQESSKAVVVVQRWRGGRRRHDNRYTDAGGWNRRCRSRRRGRYNRGRGGGGGGAATGRGAVGVLGMGGDHPVGSTRRIRCSGPNGGGVSLLGRKDSSSWTRAYRAASRAARAWGSLRSKLRARSRKQGVRRLISLRDAREGEPRLAHGSVTGEDLFLVCFEVPRPVRQILRPLAHSDPRLIQGVPFLHRGDFRQWQGASL